MYFKESEDRLSQTAFANTKHCLTELRLQQSNFKSIKNVEEDVIKTLVNVSTRCAQSARNCELRLIYGLADVDATEMTKEEYDIMLKGGSRCNKIAESAVSEIIEILIQNQDPDGT